MSLTRGKDGYYRTSIRFEGKRYPVAGKSESEVYMKIGKLRAQLEMGQKINRTATTVAQFSREWLRTYHGSDSENDKRYERIVEGFIIPELGPKKISHVTEAELQRFLNAQSRYSYSQVSKIRMTVKQIFRKARKNKLITEDPSEDLTMPQCKRGEHRALTDEETRLLLQAANERADGLYVKIMLYCGLRPQEVDVLQWRHIDLDAQILHVRQALKHKQNAIGPPKTEAGERDIPIPKALYMDLLRAEGEPDEFVITHDGRRLSEASRYRMWKAILRRMDILAGATLYRNQIVEHAIAQDLDLYDLRHTYCTNLQKSGVPLNIAKELMGHEDVSVTANIYTHTGGEELTAAIGKLSDFMDERTRAAEAAAAEKRRHNMHIASVG